MKLRFALLAATLLASTLSYAQFAKVDNGPSANSTCQSAPALYYDQVNQVLMSCGNAHTRQVGETAISVLPAQIAVTWTALSNAAAPVGTAGAAGAMTASTMCAIIVALDTYGNPTAGANESAVCVVINGTTHTSISWAWSAVTGAASYQVWVGSTGAEASYFAASASPYVQTANTGTSGTLPATNITGTQLQTMASLALNANVQSYLNRDLRVCGSGVYTSPGTTTPTLTFSIGEGGITPISVTTAAVSGTASTNAPFRFCFDIQTTTAGASGKVEAHGWLAANIAANSPAAAVAFYLDTNTAVSSTINLFNPNTLAVQVQPSLAMTSVTLRQLTIELIS